MSVDTAWQYRQSPGPSCLCPWLYCYPRCILIGLQLFLVLFSFSLWIDGAFSVCLQILKHADSPVSLICCHTQCIISHRRKRRVCLCVDAELLNDAAVVQEFSPLSFGIGS